MLRHPPRKSCDRNVGGHQRLPLFVLLSSIAIIACNFPTTLFDFYADERSGEHIHRVADEFDLTLVADDADELFEPSTSESVLEPSEELAASGDEGSIETTEDREDGLAPANTGECGESQPCALAHPVDMRNTANPPDVIAFANSASNTTLSGLSITTSGGSDWYEWVILGGKGNWIEASTTEAIQAIGVEIWGDRTIGWARVLLDGEEIWRGNPTSYGNDGANYFVYVEASGLGPGRHALRVEALGIDGGGGGMTVPVFYFGVRY